MQQPARTLGACACNWAWSSSRTRTCQVSFFPAEGTAACCGLASAFSTSSCIFASTLRAAHTSFRTPESSLAESHLQRSLRFETGFPLLGGGEAKDAEWTGRGQAFCRTAWQPWRRSSSVPSFRSPQSEPFSWGRSQAAQMPAPHVLLQSAVATRCQAEARSIFPFRFRSFLSNYLPMNMDWFMRQCMTRTTEFGKQEAQTLLLFFIFGTGWAALMACALFRPIATSQDIHNFIGGI